MIGPNEDGGAPQYPCWVVEWSDSHQHLHVAEAAETVEANFRDWLIGRHSDYRTLAIRQTKAEADAFATEARKAKGEAK